MVFGLGVFFGYATTNNNNSFSEIKFNKHGHNKINSLFSPINNEHRHVDNNRTHIRKKSLFTYSSYISSIINYLLFIKQT